MMAFLEQREVRDHEGFLDMTAVLEPKENQAHLSLV